MCNRVPNPMKSILSMLALALLALSTLNPQLSTAFAQGTGFTYQGRLTVGTNVANGIYDLKFSVYDTNLPAGVLIAGPATNSATVVSNGFFVVLLNFGNVFPGADRWLEIGVRTNGTGAFTTLAARQHITATPYAITASNLSGSLPSAQLAGNYGNAVTLNNAANSFTGNGTGLTNVNAALLGGLGSSSFWKTNGNAGANPTNGAFLGTTDNLPLEIRVNGLRALRIEPTVYGPNMIGGWSNNFTFPSVLGAAVGGGGGPSVITGQLFTNVISDSYGTIAGGLGNTAGNQNADTTDARGATVGGGNGNASSGQYSTVGGGYQNTASGAEATVVSGQNNTASGSYATVGGGYQNAVNGDYSTVAGGIQNTNSGRNATVVGGHKNTITTNGLDATVIGGFMNTSDGNYASVSGGQQNTANGMYSAVAGGILNIASGGSATVVGGNNNTASGDYATVGGGYHHTASGLGAFIGGGGYDGIYAAGNTASGACSVVGGGMFNFATNLEATVPGGRDNIAGGEYSFAAGRRAKALHGGTFVWADSTDADFATTATNQFLIRATGGVGINTNDPAGAALRVAGRLVADSAGIGTTNPAATFNVDGSARVDASTLAYSEGLILNFPTNMSASGGYGGLHFHNAARGAAVVGATIKWSLFYNNTPETGLGAGGLAFIQNNASTRLYLGTNGNVGIGTNNPQQALHVVGNILATGTVTGSSDQNAKEHFAAVSPREVLDQVAALPISRWNYKADASVTHVGPMAQDFYAAFRVGQDDTHISMVDADGVALAAIQGLNEKVESGKQKAETQIQELKTENAELKHELGQLKQLVGSLADKLNGGMK